MGQICWHCTDNDWVLRLLRFQSIKNSFIEEHWGLARARTPQDMDRTLTLIFAKLETTWNITTKISAFLQLRKKWILTKFEGCGSKTGPATPISILNYSRAWQSFKVSYVLHIWYKAGSHRVWQLVKIWWWYLKPSLRNSKLTVLSFQSIPQEVIK